MCVGELLRIAECRGNLSLRKENKWVGWRAGSREGRRVIISGEERP